MKTTYNLGKIVFSFENNCKIPMISPKNTVDDLHGCPVWRKWLFFVVFFMRNKNHRRRFRRLTGQKFCGIIKNNGISVVTPYL